MKLSRLLFILLLMLGSVAKGDDAALKQLTISPDGALLANIAQQLAASIAT